jgi:hypothetical protein
MFSRKSTAERTAAQAWDYLSSAVAAAGDNAKSVGKQTARSASKRSSVVADLAGEKSAWLTAEAGRRGAKLADRAGRRSSELADVAGNRAGAVAEEAWARAIAAADALAGRRPALPWGLIIGAGLVGAVLGWVGASTAQAALARRAENEELELAETATTPLPTFEG